MDEDAVSATESVEQEDAVRQRINREGKKNNKSKNKCRTRIDVLATPNKRLVLALYQDHANHLAKEKLERIKQNLQELYAMTPEETEKYFAEMRLKAEKMTRRKRIRDMLRKHLRKMQRDKLQQKAVKFIKKLLRRAMLYAFNNPVPPLVSVRLRHLSDIVLEQLCDLRNIDHPSREDPDQQGLFMIAVADWIAIFIEHIYYAAQLRKNEELEEIDKQKKDKLGEDYNETPAESPAVTKTETELVEPTPKEDDTDTPGEYLDTDFE